MITARYIALSMLFTAQVYNVAIAQPRSEPASSTAGIEYSSVATALTALRSKPSVVFSTNDSWVIAEERNSRTMWSFTPANHPANPSVGRRRLMEQGGRYFVETSILCEATKAACDKLHEDYQMLDRRMNEAIRSGR